MHTTPIRFKDIVQGKQKKYYQKNKEKIKEGSRNRYRNITKEQKP